MSSQPASQDVDVATLCVVRLLAQSLPEENEENQAEKEIRRKNKGGFHPGTSSEPKPKQR